jgi:hypothetical protein
LGPRDGGRERNHLEEMEVDGKIIFKMYIKEDRSE